MKAKRAAAIYGTDASAVPIHEAFFELTLNHRLDFRVLSGRNSGFILVVDDSGITVYRMLDLVEVEPWLNSSGQVVEFLVRLSRGLIKIFHPFEGVEVTYRFGQQLNVHEVVWSVD